MQQEHDIYFIRQALELGQYALGRTSPNPSVGAVVVDGHGVAGRGWTKPVGGAHAEIGALGEADERVLGATLYVTLEPCAHHGRTPPCVDAILAAGIARCVVAMEDPYPEVHGKGIEALRASGVTVETGVCEEDARELLAGYLSRVERGRPLVRAKYATTLDGRIATRTGQSRWITGPSARRQAHVFRDRADAVLVGAGTVNADNPALTTRLPDEFTGDEGVHHPLRVIVDGRGITSKMAQVYQPDLPGHTLVATTAEAPDWWLNQLEEVGVEHLVCGAGPAVDLDHLLHELGARGINEVLVEGGSQILGSFFDAGLVDRIAAFVAPIVVGGQEALGPVGGQGRESMNDAMRVSGASITTFDSDVLIQGAVLPSGKEVGI
jgi:diaminohydroxyphosphoribosylaminopyrimidine deaminase / 5-amino-6-(5-phosphoribosylamino)uracil reductase